ncbi:MAG TPA: transposase [Dehalococcoidia bacterium]|nr:transposase [Dehalococcoidia bacterium]
MRRRVGATTLTQTNTAKSKILIDQWQKEYNHVRPHSIL